MALLQSEHCLIFDSTDATESAKVMYETLGDNYQINYDEETW